MTTEELIERLREVKRSGWIKSRRSPKNSGAVGNTLEDLLGVKENNLKTADIGEWELKSRRASSSSRITLHHAEPHPGDEKFVPLILLPKYGWPHKDAGTQKPIDEMSLRHTMSAARRNINGFKVKVDRDAHEVRVSFDASNVKPKKAVWLKTVEMRVGLGELDPQPFWTFDDLALATSKLKNTCFVQAQVRKVGGLEEFHYTDVSLMRGFSLESFLAGLDAGYAYIEFDASTGHNHGTKLRITHKRFKSLFEEVLEVESAPPPVLSAALRAGPASVR